MQHYVSNNVVCPFYHKEDAEGRKIFCEGFCKGNSLQISFKKIDQLMVHKDTHCNSMEGYKRCPLFPIINKQYEVM